VSENEGCPFQDTDGDGINDNEDTCPEESGSLENGGCPELSNEVVQTINHLASQIYFVAGSYRILGRAVLDVLQEIKTLLDDNPEGNLVIEGYTSSDGDAVQNFNLSHKRANAVKAFLIQMGVNPERLRAEGFGEERPVFDNETLEGRVQNRRVQFRAEF